MSPEECLSPVNTIRHDTMYTIEYHTIPYHTTLFHAIQYLYTVQNNIKQYTQYTKTDRESRFRSRSLSHEFPGKVYVVNQFLMCFSLEQYATDHKLNGGEGVCDGGEMRFLN